MYFESDEPIEVEIVREGEEQESEEYASGSEGDDEYEATSYDSSDKEDDYLFDVYTEPILTMEDNQVHASQSIVHVSSSGMLAEVDEQYISEEILSDVGSEEDNDGKKQKKLRWPRFNEGAHFGDVSFELGMEFKNLEVFKQAIKDYTVNAGVKVKFVKNDATRCRAKCEHPCPWTILCSWSKVTNSFQVKTYNSEHTCCRIMTNKQASSKWLAVKLLPFFRTNANPERKDVVNYIKETFCLSVPPTKVYRAWAKAKILMEGSEKEQYKRLRDYCWEIIRSNPGSKCQIGVSRVTPELPPIFNRLYMCLHACKTGFLAGCRPMIGLDGCFLKGYYGRQLLSAVAQDGDNSFYPVAIAIVETESRETWTWFLTKLFEDIGVTANGCNWSFITDRQKGLIPALAEVAPESEHRFCVYHIYNNYAKQFKGLELKDLLWECARSTTMQEFTTNMNNLKEFNEKAWEYLSKIPAKQWTRAAFDTSSKSQVYTNNMCEQFNSYIVAARGKPIISMLEEIRIKIMKKMIEQKTKLQRFKGPLCPRVRAKLEANKRSSRFWEPQWVGDPNGEKFEVWCKPDRYAVDLGVKSCSCRSWDLCGIPCVHAVAAIQWKNLKPEEFVHHSLTKEAFEKVYESYVQPVNGPSLWRKANSEELQPPPIKKRRGRPKKQRRRDPIEQEQPRHPTKLKRQLVPTCKKCGQPGHNSRSCKGTNNPVGQSSSNACSGVTSRANN